MPCPRHSNFNREIRVPRGQHRFAPHPLAKSGRKGGAPGSIVCLSRLLLTLENSDLGLQVVSARHQSLAVFPASKQVKWWWGLRWLAGGHR